MVFEAFVYCLFAINPLSDVSAINTESIRHATEYQLRRTADYIQDNYANLINSGENYVGCSVYDMCETLTWGITQDEISPWLTANSSFHYPICNDSGTIPGIRYNNHDPDTGSLYTSNTCPKYYSDYLCDYDNGPVTPSIKIPLNLDTTTQEFLDATCFTNELEDIWSTRLYSDCSDDSECTSNGGTCLTDIGLCSNTQTPEIDTFIPSFVEYQYFADQRTGVLAQVPSFLADNSYCQSNYDPRLRPWYAGAASGPKDVILILDTSGSMSQTTNSGTSRLDVMKTAAKSVLDTLTYNDYATVIEFNSDASSYSSRLLSITNENLCLLENYIDDLTAYGATNYESAFEKAFEIMSDSMNSNSVTGCNAQIVLFLTDGQITQGSTDIVNVIDDLKSDVDNEGVDFKILTYGIGDDLSDSDLDTLKDISCNNNGIAYEINDIDDDLTSTMSSYYQMFVILRQNSFSSNDFQNNTWVVWIDYIDLITGYRLISANIPVYDTTTSPYTLLGISVVDIAAERLINSTASTWGNDIGIYDDFDNVFQDMLSTGKICPILNFDEDQLESIRNSAQNAQVCSESSDESGVGAIVLGIIFGGLTLVTY